MKKNYKHLYYKQLTKLFPKIFSVFEENFVLLYSAKE